MSNDTEMQPLDAATITVVKEMVARAKRRGWLKPDLTRWFDVRSVDPDTYTAAVQGGEVSTEVRGALAAVSIHGLPELPYVPNPEQIRQHIEWLIEPARGTYDDALIEIAHGEPEGGPSAARLFGFDEVAEAVDYAQSINAERRNVYIGAALRLPDAPRDQRASAEDFYVATAVPVDIDANYQRTREAMAAVCEDGLVVTTGLVPERRSQHWVRLSEPCDSDLEFAHGFRGLVEHVGADLAVKDAARVMRLGGTVAFPNGRKIERGYRTELTTVNLDPRARPTDLARLRGLAASEAVEARRDYSDRPQADGIERGGIAGGGKVVNGRERFFATKLLPRCIREWQQANLRDPIAEQLYEAAFALFRQEADNTDQRWTCEDGQRQLRSRAANTLRRLRLGRLTHLGLASLETRVGELEAKAAQAARDAAHQVAVAEQPAVPVPAAEVAFEAPGFDPWERYVVPAFPLDVLPPVLRDFVEYQAASVGVDPAAAAMAALTTLSGALDQRTTLKMKRTGDWTVRPRLWVMLVGDPSAKKTPIISACIRPLRFQEAKHVAAYQRDLARWKGMDKDERGDEPPRPVRYIFNDITTEKVGEVLSRQDRGALVEHDELSGWIGAMDRYSGGKGAGADRSFWAQAYNGGPKTIDRLQRGEVYVQNLCVAFLAGMQPDRLPEVASLTTDGLLQRFVPVMMRRPTFPAEVESDLPARRYEELVGYLLDMPPQGYQMDEGGRTAAGEFQRSIFDLEGMDGLGKSFCSFAGKLTGLHGSLALLLHIIEDPHNAPFEPVSERTVRAAARVLEKFVLPHALEFYRSTTDGADWATLQAIASYVLTTSKERLTASDFTSGVRPLRGLGTWDLDQKLSPLVAGGWLIEESLNGVVRAWTVPAGLREAMAARRETELLAKAERLKKLKTLREDDADA